MDRIYLDNAATSWPKPESVYAAVDHAQRVIGAAAGRGNYKHVIDALRLVEQTRGQIARFINAPNRRNISFSFNGTDSLSTALFGLLRPGDHVVTSVVEHNSVLRPLKELESNGSLEVTFLDCDEYGRFDESDVLKAVRKNTRLVSLIHVSNVTGAVQPVENIKRLLVEAGHDKNTRFLLDAAQSLGHIPVDVQSIGCDILAAPGHKGLLGPLGTGLLFVSDDVADEIRPLRFGGTGTDGSVEVQPVKVPDKFESGNLNLPGIAGLNAGVKFLVSDEGKIAHEKWMTHSRLLLDGINSIEGLKLQGLDTMQGRIGVFSISFDGMDCREAAGLLDVNWSVQTRAGLHCAPLIHRALGSEDQGGTIRMSVGLFNTREEIETSVEALRELVSAAI